MTAPFWERLTNIRFFSVEKPGKLDRPKQKTKLIDPAVITRGPRSRLRTERYGDLTVDQLPAPIRYSPSYVNRNIEDPCFYPLDVLTSEPVFDDFASIANAIYRGPGKMVVARMYHWTDGENLRLEDLTRGRLYFSYDPAHWAGDTPRGQALFRISCRFKRPVIMLDQAQPYEWTWERIENKLDDHQIPRDAFFHSCAKPHLEAPLGFVYNAQASIFHVEYVGTVGYSY